MKKITIQIILTAIVVTMCSITLYSNYKLDEKVTELNKRNELFNDGVEIFLNGTVDLNEKLGEFLEK